MSKPDLSEYNPYEKWPPHLKDTVSVLGGSPLNLLGLALMHSYPGLASSEADLQRSFIQNQGRNIAWKPGYRSITNVFNRLNGPNFLNIAEHYKNIPGGQTREEIYEGQVAYTGMVFKLCLAKRGIQPQAAIGRAAKFTPGKEMARIPKPVARLGLYALLSTSREQFSMTEIDDVLGLGPGAGSQMIEAPLGQGILDAKIGGPFLPSLVQFAAGYHAPMKRFVSDIESLSTQAGIQNGLDVVESVTVENSNHFSKLMALGAA